MRWFILTLVFVLDPLAILLVIAGNIHRRETKPNVVKRPEFVTGLSIAPNTSVSVKPQTLEKVENVEAAQVETLQPLVSDVVAEVTQEGIMEVTQESPPQELDFRGDEKWLPQPLDKRIVPH